MRQKRELTADEIAKRDERRRRFRELVRKIADMPEEERIALAKQTMPVTVEGHALSGVNTLLVCLQKPDATIVGGFRQWLKQGRPVRKGEHGLMIWAPLGRKEKTDSGETVTGEVDGFIPVTVFDVSQTEVAA